MARFMGMRRLSLSDAALLAVDHAVRTLVAPPPARRPVPVQVDGADGAARALTPQERRHAGALMRVNHVGEICAQALYVGQAFATPNAALRADFMRAAAEEADHLAWTAERLRALGAGPSRLNPLWYAGAFGLGVLASRLGDGVSLGFVAETERQVQAHLASHLARPEHGGLPAADDASRAVVAQMLHDEAAHAAQAEQAGAAALSAPAKAMMRAMAGVMTHTAYVV